MRQAEKVNSNISLYSDTKQRENLLNKKIQTKIQVLIMLEFKVLLTVNYNLELQLKVR